MTHIGLRSAGMTTRDDMDALEAREERRRKSEELRKWQRVKPLKSALRGLLGFSCLAAAIPAGLAVGRLSDGAADDAELGPAIVLAINGVLALVFAAGAVLVDRMPIACTVIAASAATLNAVGVVVEDLGEGLLTWRLLGRIGWALALWSLLVPARNYARLRAEFPELTSDPKFGPSRTADGLAEGGAAARRRTARKESLRRSLIMGGILLAVVGGAWGYTAMKRAKETGPPSVPSDATVARFIAAWNAGRWDAVGALAAPASAAKMSTQVKSFVRRENWRENPPQLSLPSNSKPPVGRSHEARFETPKGTLLVRFAFRDDAWVFVGLKTERR